MAQIEQSQHLDNTSIYEARKFLSAIFPLILAFTDKANFRLINIEASFLIT